MIKKRKSLTAEEHDTYIHLCGLTGKELDQKKYYCHHCRCQNLKRCVECLSDHGIIGVDILEIPQRFGRLKRIQNS